MSRVPSHPCPVAGCGEMRLHWQAVCASCWGKLPQDLRGAITKHRDRGAAHLRARAGLAAVEWLLAQREAAARMVPG